MTRVAAGCVADADASGVKKMTRVAAGCVADADALGVKKMNVCVWLG